MPVNKAMQGLSAQEMKPQLSNKNSVHSWEVKDIDTNSSLDLIINQFHWVSLFAAS
jgi:hypothetical protein